MKIEILLPILFFIGLFSLVYFVMRTVIYEMGGWKSLENQYKTGKQPSNFSAKNLKIRSISIEAMGYNNVIKLYKTSEGLLLKHGWFLKKSKYNILIPWSEIIEVRKRKIFFFTTIRLIIGQPFVTFIDLGKKDFEKIKGNIQIKSNLEL